MFMSSLFTYTLHYVFISCKYAEPCGYTFVKFLKEKGQVAGAFEEFVEIVENLSEHKIKQFRADNGGEFTSDPVQDFCLKKGIKFGDQQSARIWSAMLGSGS